MEEDYHVLPLSDVNLTQNSRIYYVNRQKRVGRQIAWRIYDE